MNTNATPSSVLEVRAWSADDGRHVQLAGELDGAERQRVQPLVDGARVGERVVVDCSGLSFVDSMGLRLLVEWHRRLDELGGRLVIGDPSVSLRQLLDVTGLDAVIEVEDSSA